MMNLRQSFDKDFCKALEELHRKYPMEFFDLEGIGESQLDINKVSKAFFAKPQEDRVTSDTSIDPNANVAGRDTITFNYEIIKPFMKLNSLYNLWLIIKEEHGLDIANTFLQAELSGSIYVNDAWDIGRPYCFNYSTYDIALKGLPMASRSYITPPKSLSSFLHQVEQFTVYAANMTLGATGLADLLIVASWYVDRIYETGYDHKIKVEDVDSYVKELLAHLIYTLNFEFRGNQSPFTNVSIYDEYFLQQLLPSYEIKGKVPNLDTVYLVQDIFLGAFNDELTRSPHTFPVVTACFSVKDEKDDSGNMVRRIRDNHFLSAIARYNLPYGFINFYMGETSTLSSCCRLRSSISDLGYANTFGAGSTKIGSLGVVTINLPRLASLADNEQDFFDNVEAFTVIAGNINNAKRVFIKDRIRRGALPLYDMGFMDLDRQYSTCGFTGLYEACSIMGYDMKEDDGIKFAERILDTINKVNEHLSAHYKTPHNMEQVPAESSAVKLAKKDDLLGVHDEAFYFDLYSNQFIPLWQNGVDLLDRLRIQGVLDKYCTGGAICHLNIGDKIENIEVMKALVHHACECGVVYFAVNYKILQCSNNHITVGNDTDKTCSICHSPITDVYTRVVGFLTNTKHWNKTRREKDFPSRHFTKANKETVCQSQ